MEIGLRRRIGVEFDERRTRNMSFVRLKFKIKYWLRQECLEKGLVIKDVTGNLN